MEERAEKQKADDQAARKIITDQVVTSLNHIRTHLKDHCQKNLSPVVAIAYVEKTFDIYIESFTKSALE